MEDLFLFVLFFRFWSKCYDFSELSQQEGREKDYRLNLEKKKKKESKDGNNHFTFFISLVKTNRKKQNIYIYIDTKLTKF